MIMKDFFGLIFSDGLTLISCIIICFVFGVLLYKLISLKMKFEDKIEEYDDEKNKNKSEATSQITSGKNEIGVSEGIPTIRTGFMEDYQEKYEKIESDYKATSQLISILPMLGILGTVSGLIKQITSVGVEEITNSIGLALITTFLGLLFAIILKWYDSKVSVTSDRVQTIITKFEKQLSNMYARKQLEEGK